MMNRSMLSPEREKFAKGFAPISTTDRKEYFQLKDAIEDGSKTPQELSQEDKELIKTVEAVLEAERQEREKKAEGGKFPDLTGDGEVTQADILKGRGIFSEGSKVEDNEFTARIKELTDQGKSRSYATRIATKERNKRNYDALTPEEKERRRELFKKSGGTSITERMLKDGTVQRSVLKDGVETITTIKKDGTKTVTVDGVEREKKAEGSMMMPTEGMPVDTYPNIPEDEMEEAMASQLPDEEMEDNYIEYVMDESLNDEEQDYLADVLQNDPRLSDILDKVITVASEFSGAGEVDGPGTGVSDSIPARLSDGEFVMTRKATDQIGAENLQRMMDDAERAYDGGVQSMAIGGMVEEEEEKELNSMSQTREEIEKLMMSSNQSPSLR